MNYWTEDDYVQLSKDISNARLSALTRIQAYIKSLEEALEREKELSEQQRKWIRMYKGVHTPPALYEE